MIPKWPCTLKGQRYPIYMFQNQRVSNFTPFFVYFRVTGQFETTESNDPKITFNSIGHRYLIYHHYPWIPNFPPFSSIASRFGVTDHFETNAPNDPKINLNTKRSKVHHIYILQLSPSPKLHSVSLFWKPLSSFRSFSDKCLKWPQNDLDTKRSKVSPHIHVTTTCESQI